MWPSTVPEGSKRGRLRKRKRMGASSIPRRSERKPNTNMPLARTGSCSHPRITGVQPLPRQPGQASSRDATWREPARPESDVTGSRGQMSSRDNPKPTSKPSKQEKQAQKKAQKQAKAEQKRQARE